MGWSMPVSSKNWWDDDSHPDARAHREFLAQYGEVAERPSLPRRKASNPAGYITKRDFDRCLEHIGKLVGEELAKRDARIAELEARPVGLNYAGVFKPTASYPKHSAVSHAGSVWCAKKDFPSGEPGTANSGWQLVCKRGRDGKDGKNGQ
jgi:hypothetical protein